MIRLYRLTTGEDIIGTPVEAKDYPDLFEEDSINHIDYEYLKRPFVLIPMPAQPGKSTQIGFHPYIPYTRDEVTAIKKQFIIAESKPDTNLIDAYEKHTSNILQPKSKIIT